MSDWYIALAVYFLIGVGCYIGIMAFFAPRDGPPEDPVSPEEIEECEESKPLPFSSAHYLFAIPWVVLFILLSPVILPLFCWQKSRQKR